MGILSGIFRSRDKPGQNGRQFGCFLFGKPHKRQIRDREICDADDGGVQLREDPVRGDCRLAITILQIYR